MDRHDIDNGGTAEEKAKKHSALFVAALSSFLTPFMGSSVNIALPVIGKEFGMDAVMLGWVATSYLLAAAMFLVPLGSLADRHGRKRVFMSGIILYTSASFLCGIAPSGGFLVAIRVLQGIGGSMIFGTSVAILTSVYPPRERGKSLGITISAVYFGLSLGPFLGGVLTQRLGWRAVFLFNVPLGFLIIAAVLWKLHGEWYGDRDGNFDYRGSALYSVMLLAMMYGFASLPEARGFLLIITGAILFILFVTHERRTAKPVLHLNLFLKNTAFAFSNLAAFLNYSATYAVGFLMSLYLQYIKAFTPQQAGTILIVQPIFMAILSPLAGRLSDKIEPRYVASAGMAITSLSLFMFAFIDTETSLTSIVIFLGILGIGIALFSSPNTNAIMGSVERRFYGLASAMTSTMRLTGQMFSMGVTMLLLTLLVGKVEITPENYDRFVTTAKVAFSLFAIFCGLGIFASLARGSVLQNTSTNTQESSIE